MNREPVGVGRRSAGRAQASTMPRNEDAAVTLPPSAESPKATRRRRGEPRRLLLAAARELFSTQGYAVISTREIAEHAGVSETLLFRHFGSKAGLFREALALPFVEFIQDFSHRWRSGEMDALDDESFARQLNGGLYDLFRQNRSLVLMLWADNLPRDDEWASIGMAEIDKAMRELVKIGSEETIRRQGKAMPRHDLATRATLAMVAGMAVFGESFYGKRRPSRRAIVEELTQTSMHGRLHRNA
ncbi:TetR/AcrR family transcriptional regulator [Frankia sp. CcI49]|uniref:TetR/AcrR family transcriptional regulator n=1 Tax=Frankia sp. CcI49 TaxID=1745382 RepID=UPI0013042433|nr:TetR/AcrR family transcriptional regulator [Frankia sp. CcI49]